MGKKRPHWLDKPEFAWTPEPPLHPQAPIPGEVSSEPKAAARAQPSPAPWSARQTLGVPPWLQRIAIALGQGLLLLILLLGRERNWWPDNGASAGLNLALLLAPLLAIQGLGRMAPRTLLTWSLGAAVFLFGLGFYQHWRAAGVDAGSSGLWLAAMAGAILFIGQSLLLAHASARPLTYGALHKAS